MNTYIRHNYEGISIMKFTQESRPSTILVEETAKVFIQVFAGHPWFEVNKCGNCGHFFGPNNRFGETCLVVLQEFLKVRTQRKKG